MAAKDYKIIFENGEFVLTKFDKEGKPSKTDKRILEETEILGLIYSYSRRHCIEQNVTEYTIYNNNEPKVEIKVNFSDEEIKAINDAIEKVGGKEEN